MTERRTPESARTRSRCIRVDGAGVQLSLPRLRQALYFRNCASSRSAVRTLNRIASIATRSASADWLRCRSRFAYASSVWRMGCPEIGWAAAKALDELKARSQHEHVSPVAIALVYAGLREHTSAFEWLNRAVAERNLLLLRIHWPLFDMLRDDSRFQALLHAMGPDPSK